MPEDFQQTVDLREKIERRKMAAAVKNKANPLDKIYKEEMLSGQAEDWRKIDQPEIGRPREGLVKVIVFIVAVFVVSATVYALFFRQKSVKPEALSRGWYAVKLVDGEIFYGQIANIKDDPVYIANVYYNYDQAKQTDAAKDTAKVIEETGNIRLVKRGKETHGPDGSMNVVRAQVLYMEPLKSESKVLQAILQYEK